ncbi:hypothetical protein MTO96_044740 [Rhipicephalus appendiculatus]
MMSRNESRKPDRSSSSSEGGRSLRKLKRRCEDADATTNSAIPVPPLDGEAGTNKSSVWGRRSSKRQPSSTGSFCSVRSRTGPAARDPEHSALIAAAASELEVDARRSQQKRRVHEVPASPTEEPPEDSTTKARLPLAGRLLPGNPVNAGGAPSTSRGTAESSQAFTRGRQPADGIASTQFKGARRLAAAKLPWKRRQRTPESVARKGNCE